MPSIDANRNRMLALIATVLATAALRASYPVTMPLAAAIENIPPIILYCIITMAIPARHPEKAGKLQPPAVQRMVSDQLRCW